jgi:hypothetical protein
MNRYEMTFLGVGQTFLKFYAPSDRGAAEHADRTWEAHEDTSGATGFELRREGDLKVIHRRARADG